MTKIVNLGKELIAHKLLVPEQLEHALLIQGSTSENLHDIIIQLGYLSVEVLDDFLAQKLQIPVINLKNFPLDMALAHYLPERHARRLHALILEKNDKGFLVGVTDPCNILIQDELARLLNAPLNIALIHQADLLDGLKKVYRRVEQIDEYAQELSTTMQKEAYTLQAYDQGDVPVARLLKSIFDDGMRVNATDIHLEPEAQLLRIRQRIDGLLQEHIVKDKRIAAALTQRLKLMANLDIAERRLPQDGAFTLKVEGEMIEVRLSTMPTQYGESVAMRLLRHNDLLLNLSELGLSQDTVEALRKNIVRPYGLILVTGPTGSGKTTSLYGMLTEINSVDKKIITVEDPVEYKIARVNQVQVNPKVDLTFSRVLRSTLRQDPDVIMIGEIRDVETAEIAIRAALTGHLVLATLHTNDAIGAVIRLIDMGVQSYLISAALRLVMSQRLVRLICDNCVESYKVDKEDHIRLAALCHETNILPDGILYRGKGCPHCSQTGCRGRMGISETLELNAQMIEALRANDQAAYIRLAKERMHGNLLIHSALNLAEKGKIAIEEVLRIASEFD